MPDFTCQCCNYRTERKSSYDNHLKSSKHLQKLNNQTETQSVSSLNSLEYTTTTLVTDNSRILELEYQLKMKDAEIQNIINEYTLKLQMKDLEIKHKDELITMLQNKPQLVIQEMPKQVIAETIEIPKETNKPKLPVKECLEKYLSNAPTIEKCRSNLYKDEYNSYITEIDVQDKPMNILNVNRFKINDFESTGVSNAISIIEKFFDKFDENMLPFYCSDKRRNILYIKTNDGWIKETKQNIEEFDKLLLVLAKEALGSVYYAVANTELVFNKNKKAFLEIYGKNEQDWCYNNKNEILNVLTLIGNDDTRHGEGEQTRENKRLVVKNLKIALSKMSKSFSDCESE